VGGATSEAGEVDPLCAGPVDELLQRGGDVGGADDELAALRVVPGGQAHRRPPRRGAKRAGRGVGHEPAAVLDEQPIREPFGLVHVRLATSD
jgi:hypothetical protein